MEGVRLKLYKVLVKTFRVGVFYYDLFVLAHDENEMYKTVRDHTLFQTDPTAEIDTWDWVDYDHGNARVL